MFSTNHRSNPLFQWSGWALLLAGILTAIAILLHPDEGAEPGAVLSAGWIPIHVTFIVSILLSLFGLTGIYLRQREQVGGAGLVGYMLMMAGSALFVAILTIDTFIVPALAANPATASLLDESGPLFGGPLGLVFVLTGVVFALGVILTGITTFRAGVLPGWAGLILLIGVLLAFSPPLPHLFGLIGGVALGVSYIWLGYALSLAPTTTSATFQQATA